jgi:hypothetical protein
MVIVAVAAIVFATSAFAQSARTERRAPRVHDPMLGYNASDRTVVSVAGAYVGRDPDPNIRAQLLRFPGNYISGGF